MPTNENLVKIEKIKYNGRVSTIDPDTGYINSYDEFEYYYEDKNKTFNLIRTPFTDIQRVMVMYGIREVTFNKP